MLSSFVDFESFLVQVNDIDETAQTLNVLSAVGYDINGSITPDCNSLFEPGAADFSLNPVFTAGPSDMILPVGGEELTIEDFGLRATFNSDGSSIENILFIGRADTRALDTLLGSNTCTMATLLGDTCVPCNDGKVKCLDMYAEAQQADWNSSIDLGAQCP